MNGSKHILKFVQYIETYAEAEEKRKSMRAKEPALYNEDRLYEQPIPVCEMAELPMDDGTEQTTFHHVHATNDVEDPLFDGMSPLLDYEVAANESTQPTIDGTDSTIDCANKTVPSVLRENRQLQAKKHNRLSIGKKNRVIKAKTRMFGYRNAASGSSHKKPLRSRTASIFIETDNLPTNEVNALSSNSPELNAARIDLRSAFIKTEPLFQSMDTVDEQAVGSVFSEWEHGDFDENEISWRGMMPCPKTDDNLLQIKANDKLSGNIPFATNVRDIHYYLKQSFFICTEIVVVLLECG